MNVNKLEYRMYGLVPYQLSDKQKCIQYGHSVVEYGLDHNFGEVPAYKKWSKTDKTFIVLDGGTTNDDEESRYYGTLQKSRDLLKKNSINFAEFREPDLNNCLTAVTFLVDERVFKRRPEFEGDTFYPDFKEWFMGKNEGITGYITESEDIPFEELHQIDYREWVQFIGGNKNLFLRKFLPRFKLA